MFLKHRKSVNMVWYDIYACNYNMVLMIHVEIQYEIPIWYGRGNSNSIDSLKCIC